jgi:CBS domain-containing protein
MVWKRLDLAGRTLLIVGGVNWLAMGAGRKDLVAWATRSPKARRGLGSGRSPNLAARVVHGVVGGAAVYSLVRLAAQTASRKRRAADSSVRGAMTPQPQTVTPATSVAEAAEILRRENVGSVPVVEQGRLVGILTDRDIALRTVAERRDPTTVTVGEIASSELVTVESTDSLDEALRLMASRQVRRLPVVEDGKLVGMLAQADVARRVPDAETGEVVEQISS